MKPHEFGPIVLVGGRGEFGQFLQHEILPTLGVSSIMSIDRETSRATSLSRLQQARHVVLSTPLADYVEQACELVHHCSNVKSPTTLWLIPSVQAGVWQAVSATLESVANPYLSAVFVHPMYGPNGFKAIEPEAWTFRNILTATVDGAKHTLMEEVSQIAAVFYSRFNIPTVSFSPEEHDRFTAYSQGLSYCVARLMFEQPELDALVRAQLPHLYHSFHANHDLILDYLRINAYMPQVVAAFTETWTRTRQRSCADILEAFAQADTLLNHDADSRIPTKWYVTLRRAAREIDLKV